MASGTHGRTPARACADWAPCTLTTLAVPGTTPARRDSVGCPRRVLGRVSCGRVDAPLRVPQEDAGRLGVVPLEQGVPPADGDDVLLVGTLSRGAPCGLEPDRYVHFFAGAATFFGRAIMRLKAAICGLQMPPDFREAS